MGSARDSRAGDGALVVANFSSDKAVLAQLLRVFERRSQFTGCLLVIPATFVRLA
jgi:hypothetical protein